MTIARIPGKKADPFYATPEWEALRKACLERDGYRCVICGAPAVVADHIISRKRGGLDRLDNLRSLCRTDDNRLREPGFDRPRPQGV
jgi:5-methylcytosine-specific restriction enzyme A